MLARLRWLLCLDSLGVCMLESAGWEQGGSCDDYEVGASRIRHLESTNLPLRTGNSAFSCLLEFHRCSIPRVLLVSCLVTPGSERCCTASRHVTEGTTRSLASGSLHGKADSTSP